MMKKIILSNALLLISLCGQAQQVPEKVNFSKNGEFKIAQFADMHLGYDQEKNMIVVDIIEEVLDSKEPDLVVFTGGITTTDEVSQAWETIAGELATHQLPWTAILGNHDDEYAVKRDEIIRIIQQQPYCMIKNITEGIRGEGNHIIPIYGSADDKKVAALFYCLDTNVYPKLKTVKGYDWIGQSRINWYTREGQKYTEQGRGQPLFALALLHIPLPEHIQAWESFDTKRYDDRNEKERSPNISGGMSTQMLECGGVMGILVGHDHANDYIATPYNITLEYGRASGGKNTYGDKTPGSRMIVLKEGKREFSTWLHEKENTKRLNVCTYPDSFVKEK